MTGFPLPGRQLLAIACLVAVFCRPTHACDGQAQSPRLWASEPAGEAAPPDDDSDEPGTGLPRRGAATDNPIDLTRTIQAIPMKTLGGRQFWGDVHYFHGWRIQRNVFTGHCRLLDANDVRHCSGTGNECLKTLEAIKSKERLPPMKGKAVIVIHGIIRSSKSFAGMTDALKKEGYQVFGFDYPSTRLSIPESAEYLASCIESLEGVEELNFVVHSMGGLVVRSYLSTHEDKRIKRMVMLGVPNNGAEMADLMRKVFLFKAIYGPAGQQLVTDKDGLIAGLPIPEFEFAVVAGGRGTPDGFNPLIPGDDDGTVCVASAKLPGAADFSTVNCLHSFLMHDRVVIDQTLRFLREGRLRETGDPVPIPRPPMTVSDRMPATR